MPMHICINTKLRMYSFAVVKMHIDIYDGGKVCADSIEAKIHTSSFSSMEMHTIIYNYGHAHGHLYKLKTAHGFICSCANAD